MRQSIHGPCLHDSQLVASQNSRCFSSLVLHIRHGKDRREAGELPSQQGSNSWELVCMENTSIIGPFFFLFFFLSHSNLEDVLADILRAIIIISNYGLTLLNRRRECKSGVGRLSYKLNKEPRRWFCIWTATPLLIFAHTGYSGRDSGFRAGRGGWL